MNALLVSFFFSKNIGDLLISETLSSFYGEKFSIVKFDYSRSYSDYHSSNIVQIIVNKLLKNNIFRKYSILRRVHNYISSNMQEYENWKSFKHNLARSDFLIIGGGNMIMDISKDSSSADYFGKYIQIAKKLKKKVYVSSIGVGPFINKTQIKKTAEVLKRCDYVTFRDKLSLDCLRPFINSHKNIHVSIDPAFLLPQRTKKIKKEIIAINIINYKLINPKSDYYDISIKSYAALADQIVETTGYNVILFQTEVNDYSTVLEVYNMVKFKNRIDVCFIDSLDSLLNLYDSTLILIGTRMHSMIIAYTQNIPIIGLTWQQKVTALFEIIEEKKAVYDFCSMDANISKIVEQCVYKIQNIEHEKSIINRNLKSIRKKFEINNTISDSLKSEFQKAL